MINDCIFNRIPIENVIKLSNFLFSIGFLLKMLFIILFSIGFLLKILISIITYSYGGGWGEVGRAKRIL